MREIKRDIVGLFIVSADGKVLLGHNVKGGVFEDQWVIAGGGIELGESNEAAAIREAREELGIDISRENISFFPATFSAKAEKTLRESGERVMVDMEFYDAIIRLNRDSTDVRVVCEDDFKDGTFLSREELENIDIAYPTHRRLVELGMLKEQEK